MMPNFKRRLLLLGPALLLAAPLAVRLVGERGDRMERAQRELTGPGAINCGVEHSTTIEGNVLTRDSDGANACAVAAFKARQPYRVRLDDKDVGSPDEPWLTSSGSVLTPGGEVYFFYAQYSAASWWSGPNHLDHYRQALCPAPIARGKVVDCSACGAGERVRGAGCSPRA